MSNSKIAVVTAGGSNLGSAICLGLAGAGWDIFLTYLHSLDECQAVIDAITALGRKATAIQCDAGVKADVVSFYQAVHDQTGTAPDVLVNNAGVQTWSSLLDLQEEDWDLVIRTNLKGCFLNTQTAAKWMIQEQRRGRIVNLGSGCNQFPFPNLVDYTASKGGIEMFTKVSAVELGAYGITVNCVAPGAVETARTQLEAPAYAEQWSKITPIGRVGTPQDVAHAVLMLVDEKSDFITGQTWLIDGGVFTRPNWPYSG